MMPAYSDLVCWLGDKIKRQLPAQLREQSVGLGNLCGESFSSGQLLSAQVAGVEGAEFGERIESGHLTSCNVAGRC